MENGMAISRPEAPSQREGWVTLVTNAEYAIGALVLGQSLRDVRTARETVAMVTKGVPLTIRNQLATVYDHVVEVDMVDSGDSATLWLIGRPELGVTLSKLNAWRLTDFARAVFLDADCLVVQNCDELFEREELSAVADCGWPDCFNSGVFVFRPSHETYCALTALMATSGSFDGGDQGLLNTYWDGWHSDDRSKHLSFVYNLHAGISYTYLPAMQQYGRGAKIVHFLGANKPWASQRNSGGQTSSHFPDFTRLWWQTYDHVLNTLRTAPPRPQTRMNVIGGLQGTQLDSIRLSRTPWQAPIGPGMATNPAPPSGAIPPNEAVTPYCFDSGAVWRETGHQIWPSYVEQTEGATPRGGGDSINEKQQNGPPLSTESSSVASVVPVPPVMPQDGVSTSAKTANDQQVPVADGVLPLGGENVDEPKDNMCTEEADGVAGTQTAGGNCPVEMRGLMRRAKSQPLPAHGLDDFWRTGAARLELIGAMDQDGEDTGAQVTGWDCVHRTRYGGRTGAAHRDGEEGGDRSSQMPANPTEDKVANGDSPPPAPVPLPILAPFRGVPYNISRPLADGHGSKIANESVSTVVATDGNNDGATSGVGEEVGRPGPPTREVSQSRWNFQVVLERLEDKVPSTPTTPMLMALELDEVVSPQTEGIKDTWLLRTSQLIREIDSGLWRMSTSLTRRKPSTTEVTYLQELRAHVDAAHTCVLAITELGTQRLSEDEE